MHAWRAYRQRSAWTALLLSALIATGYGVLAFKILRPEAVHSIDAAIKYVQARSLLAHRFLAMPLDNRAAFIDPSGDYLPFKAPFVFESHGATLSIFSTPVALVFAPWSPLGVAALAWPALLALGVLLFLTYKFSEETPVSWALPAVLGLATMVWYYAIQANENLIAVAFSTTSLIVAAHAGGTARHLALGGMLLGLATIFREEAALVGPGLLAARWYAGARGRTLVREWAIVGASAVAVLVVMGAIDAVVFGRPVAAHLRHAVAPLHDYLGSEDALPILRTMSWRERYETLVHYWLLGNSDLRPALLLLGVLAIGVWVRLITGSALVLLVGVGSVLVSATLEARALVAAPKFVAGLFRLCPFLVFALLPLPPGSPSSLARRLALVTSGCYVILVFLGLNTSGGKPLGPRFLLPILPLLVVAAWEAIVTWTSKIRVRPTDGLVGVIGLALVVIAAVIELGSTIPAFVQRNWSDAATIQRVLASPSRFVVIDNQFTFQLVAPTYFERTVLLADNDRDAVELGERLAAARVTSFDLVSRHEKQTLTFPPYTLARERRDGRLVRQVWRR